MSTSLGSFKSANTMSFLHGLLEAQQIKLSEKGNPTPLVALSRDCGAGGETIARHLAEKLGTECYDRTLLDAVAQSAGREPHLLAELDEKVAPLRNAWILTLLSNQMVLNDDYRNHLVSVVLGLAKKGGIVVGRGAHIILAEQRVLRLRIVGSEDICAHRLAEDEHIDLADARRRVEETNHERGEFVWRHFQRRLNDPTTFDLVINTDHIKPEDAADLTIAAMGSRGMLPRHR